MSQRVVYLLFALAAIIVSAKDLTKSIKIKIIKPGDVGSTSDTLEQLFTFDQTRTDFANVVAMELLEFVLGGDQMHDTVVVANMSGVFISEGVAVSATADLDTSSSGKAQLDVKWINKDDGYCRSYMCRVHGQDDHGAPRSVSRTIKVRSSDDVPCNRKVQQQSSSYNKLEEKISECCVTSEEVQSNAKAIEELTEKVDQFPEIVESVDELSKTVMNEVRSNAQKFEEMKNELSKASQENGQEALMKVLSIDRSKYEVSRLYKTQIYLATKQSEDFDFPTANEECKANGGYLVEFDGEEEQNFVTEFIKTTESSLYYTGGNDINDEGNFIYYNSNKPVVGLKWINGEPNNYGGHEDCMDIQPTGLNDNICDQKAKFICEIPLF